MAYLINRYNGEQLVVLDDGTVDTTTSINLVGRNYTGYGEIQNENFLFLLENFSSNVPPTRPLSGQIWYDRLSGIINVYDGNEWRNSSLTTVSSTPPERFINGSMWLDSDTDQLYVRNNSDWKLIGPEALDGYQETKVKAVVIIDVEGVPRPVLMVVINGIVTSIMTNSEFQISNSILIPGFKNLVKGTTLLSTDFLSGNVQGNSSTATRLETPRAINGIQFDGSVDVLIKASTPSLLIAGTYLSGSNFDGAIERTWSVDASPNNIIGKVVARNSQGNFAAGTITANLVGNVQGNVSTATGTSTFNIVEATRFIGESLSGNAASATRLETSRTINGVDFNGTANITVTSAAVTLTGNTLATNVTNSRLTTIGILNSLEVLASGITVGNSLEIYSDTVTNADVIKSSAAAGLSISVNNNGDPNLDVINVIPGDRAVLLGAEDRTTIVPRVPGSANLGTQAFRFNKLFSNNVNAGKIETETINSTSADDSVTIDANLIVSGNLVINGNLTTINSSEVQIEDLLITVGKNAVNPTQANGGGIFVAGAQAELRYSTTGDKWTINKKLDAGNNDIITTGVFQGTATSARYADLAENYTADNQYEYGTVLEFGGSFEVTIAGDETPRIAGIVSKNPAYLMNSELAGKFVLPLALQGRVYCKVKGTIKQGDMLVSAGAGFAKAKLHPEMGTVIGKSLQNSNSDIGIIEVVVGRM